ncbi:1-acyl-sn-glycerol-3-phosphate acyltransferase [Actinacidiphila rubida]|uniref:1-acyl-sn-glycerol-3-phosphate acyltransferase n=1 Tax=Actinacidiphila rubida TaxID=310780 RepID=A0A1H8MER0_9ACTN|nr:lysophospholipid acyltransferase family protein [Actinacidiphila rubida]SEO15851.1 1-acyl-sn-glycerol-3-phosphate acyltransferase [Actinacidiphila rubida]
MTDAKVIPFDEDSRARRGAGRSRARAKTAKSANAAGTAKGPKTPAKPPRSPQASPATGAAAEHGGLASVPEAGAAGEAEPAAGIPAQAAASRDAGGQEARTEPSQGREDAAGAAGGAEEGADLTEPVAPSLGAALTGVADRLLGGHWERKVASGLAFLRRRVTGDYEVDEFGYDADLTDQVLMSLLRPLFDTYFRVEVKGIENIPAEGGALVVCNHSGTLPMDGLMAQVAVHDHHPAGRHLRLLAADLVFMLPLVNELARKAGHTLACSEDAQMLLERGEVVGVMPEGFKGLGKPFSERYKLQRFGRGGFVATALKTGVPIIPCSVVGAEEIYPMIGNSRTAARMLGVPYFPLTPTFPWLGPLGLVPLPTKWTIQFGTPIPTDTYPAEAAEDPMLVFNLTDQVRETIQHTLYELLVQRRSVFF